MSERMVSNYGAIIRERSQEAADLLADSYRKKDACITALQDQVRKLARTVIEFCTGLDDLMTKEPSSYDRGRAIYRMREELEKVARAAISTLPPEAVPR